ncbi:AMP-binding protein [Stenotrophomonas mori]|uniref:AMP-binding protein n=1 Tax=Stenotrophomonas mori TaxID=2871096 RepID=A0ABT0SH77_9GAMM|nr:AMP-binding protein [Stenotrophomonas mori]MCL7714683.1 AMP-binding protein [Stenotrophomonas mori]
MAEWVALDRLLERPRPGRGVGVHAGETIDHAGFHHRVRRWQAAFAANAGRDWAVYFEDTMTFAAALFGAWHAGKRVVICPDDLPATRAALRPRVAGFAADIAPSWPAVEAPEDHAAALQRLDMHACELVVFTSGSTGEPSPIRKRLHQLASEVQALQDAFGAELDGVQVHGTVSHQHIYGLLFRVLWPLAAGHVIQPRRFFHEDLARALSASQSVLVATPAHLKRLPEQLDWASVRGRLRAVFSSGGPLPDDAARQVRQWLGVAPTEIYGSSETGGIAWRRWEGAAVAAWRPLPSVQWRVESDGCLAVASPHLENDDWWNTQDRVEVLADGRFRLLGRVDRIVKIEERRVSLDALERALRADARIAEARVLVLAGAREQLAAVLVPADPSLLDADDATRRAFTRALDAVLAAGHDAVTRPRRWRLVGGLPLNPQGKVTQSGLAALFHPERPVPRWTERSAAAAALELALEPSLRVFEGHFPQARILPGVAQLDWAIHFGREAFAIPPRFVRMDAVKFQQVARPGDVLSLRLDWDAGRGVLAFRYTSGHGVHASGKVVFDDA